MKDSDAQAAWRVRGMAWACALGVMLLAAVAWGEERFPPPEFRGGHTQPAEQFVAPQPVWWNWILPIMPWIKPFLPWTDVILLVAALGVSAYFALAKRSRWGIFALMTVCVAYFGFVRQGCVCPVGSIQNVSQALANGGGLPWTVALTFLLPLVTALFFGRVFCAGVCPLGAVQDLVLTKPVRVPAWVEAGLGLFAYGYLGLAVLYAANGSAYVICEWDPFVGFFRFSGSVGMLLLGAGILVASMFVGRVYCRWICPYSVLLRIVAPLSQWKVHVSPKACVDCRLCEGACPFGQINEPTRETKRDGWARGRLAAAVVAAPVIVVVLAGLGYAGRNVLAQKDRRVQLAQYVYEEEHGRAGGKRPNEVEDALRAWRETGRSAESVYAEAAGVATRFGWSGAILGAWMGGVIGWRLVRLTLPRRQKDYDADPAGCVACARCFEKCPVELERRGIVVTVGATKGGNG